MNRRLNRRDFLRLSTAAAIGAILAACKPAATPAPVAEEKPKEAEKPEEKPAAPAEKVTLTFWSHSNPAFVRTNEGLIKKFQETHPDIEVKYENFEYGLFIETIQTSMAAKKEADIMEMFGSWVQSYAKGGTILPMDEGVMSLPEARELFFDAPLDGYVWEGKHYGLPNEFNLENGAVLVNKTMVEEAKLGWPPKWGSWADLVTDAQKLVKIEAGTMTVAGFNYVTADGLAFLLWEGILQRGGDYWAKDKVHLNLTSDQARETVQWLVDMAQKDKVVDPLIFNAEENWVGESFFASMVGIGFIGPWVVPMAREQYPDVAFEWDYVRTPYIGDKPLFAADSGWGKVVSPYTKNKEAAWEFVRFMCADVKNCKEWNIGTGTIPALKAVAEDPTLLDSLDWIAPCLEVIPYGRYVGDLQDRDYVWYEVVYTHILAALQGTETVEEACAKMEEEANAKIDEKVGK